MFYNTTPYKKKNIPQHKAPKNLPNGQYKYTTLFRIGFYRTFPQTHRCEFVCEFVFSPRMVSQTNHTTPHLTLSSPSLSLSPTSCLLPSLPLLPFTIPLSLTQDRVGGVQMPFWLILHKNAVKCLHRSLRDTHIHRSTEPQKAFCPSSMLFQSSMHLRWIPEWNNLSDID